MTTEILSVSNSPFKDYTENINQDTKSLNNSSNTTQFDMERRKSVSDFRNCNIEINHFDKDNS